MAWRPAWLVLLGVALVPRVAAFGRIEARRLTGGPVSTGRAVAAAVAVAVGMGILARRGFAVPGMPGGLPLVPFALLAAGWLLASPARGRA